MSRILQMKKRLFAGMAIIAVVVVVLTVILINNEGDREGEAKDMVNVPLVFEGATNVGSIGIRLSYDSTTLKLVNVKPGGLAENAMLDYNVPDMGEITIGIIDSTGIDGDGTLAVISFNPINENGTSVFRLSDIQTHDASTLIDIINVASDGNFNGETGSILTPKISFPR